MLLVVVVSVVMNAEGIVSAAAESVTSIFFAMNYVISNPELIGSLK